jgi:hypothetical protein
MLDQEGLGSRLHKFCELHQKGVGERQLAPPTHIFEGGAQHAAVKVPRCQATSVIPNTSSPTKNMRQINMMVPTRDNDGCQVTCTYARVRRRGAQAIRTTDQSEMRLQQRGSSLWQGGTCRTLSTDGVKQKQSPK